VAVQFEDAWERKDIEFDADLEDAAYTQADPGLLELVWTNLLSNAVKFTSQGGSITLRQTRANGKIYVSVTDTGCGMDEKTIKGGNFLFGCGGGIGEADNRLRHG